jgi:protein-tyrosine phosphatase
VTASVLTGSWGERAIRTAKWLFERDAVHVLASDAHDNEQRRPLLSAARDAAAELWGMEVARAVVEENPRAMVTGQPLPYFPNPARK